MNNLDRPTTTRQTFTLGEADFVGEPAMVDYRAMQPDLPERTLSIRIVAITLSFLAVLHLTGVLLVPNYGSFTRMHFLSISVVCFTFALLTAIHAYTNRMRNLR